MASPLFLPSSPADNPGPHGPADASPGLLFAAATTHVAHVADVLALVAAIHPYALMVVSPDGVTFFAEYNHVLSVQAAVDASLFLVFRCAGAAVQLGINVQMVSSAFAAAAATGLPRAKGGPPLPDAAPGPDPVWCHLKYRGAGHALVVEFEDRLMSEQIEFATFVLDVWLPHGDAGAALALDHAALRFEAILQSDILAVLLLDLHSLGTEDLLVYVGGAGGDKGGDKGGGAGLVDFVLRGAIGVLKLVYPRARAVLQKAEVHGPGAAPGPVVCTLGFASFLRIFRAVRLSSKCKLMGDAAGVLCVQLLCKHAAAPSYPGTLVAFHMLEKTAPGGTAHDVHVDIAGLFDDRVYQEVREYGAGTGGATGGGTGVGTDEPAYPAAWLDTAPFSYQAFRRPLATGEPPAKKQAPRDADLPEVPLFL
ncbi:hypothetical protein METBIDRAFT_11181 [Metschnikowia bicuspidata var. bicuspidata NRRL YB-4993]|uniref:Uncharacterized protein n=1 Tax=Metschnikowia bicuspidata var. bicuspidata NRRL YB-4993 TaxID=869754 RepID=A0A1A0HEA6_9ASCO|nr:hypothetical protein METBIDRAFT_11181 [Metschnikowia bicuspidata var. bicuspidata NRRL YB-4993]OBA22326.1 hypothetical protein METBIDRAFT_11181 [Metschnikowia bicuspidata var. bicuspidata NRRL YB-4993]